MKKRGFTLAEVLITLVIIGIIAAMTIPTLMNKTNEQETVVAVKKTFSIFSQAYKRLIAENGEIYLQNLGATEEEATKNFGDMIVPFLNVQKNCGQSTDGDCWSTDNGGMYKMFDGSDWFNWNTSNAGYYYKIRLADGMAMAFTIGYNEAASEASGCYVIGRLSVDVNGDKAPNTAGIDVFPFWITNVGLIPFGMPNSSSFDELSTCRTTGRGCTAWVVTKGNMDYLRKEVSW